jgi:undecaprenyl-diphosphatase
MVRFVRKIDIALAAGVAKIPKYLYPLMTFATYIGNLWLVIIGMSYLIIDSLISNQPAKLKGLILLACLIPLAEFIKLFVRRTRPKSLYVEQKQFKTYSFPSGHAYVSALMSGYVVYQISPGNILSMAIVALIATFAILVGVSRVYLGAHFPTDVVAGWILAVSVLSVINGAV